MPRQIVEEFSEAMEEVLQMNDYKKGWGSENCSIPYLEGRLQDEVNEYFNADHLKPKELLDIANFAMMIWSRRTKKVS